MPNVAAMRRRIMRAMRSSGTAPALAAEEALRAANIPFSQRDESLPGTPDFVLSGRRVVLFVHGCFWHGHRCRGRRLPRVRRAFWRLKLRRNEARDRRVTRALRRAGWAVVVAWECEATDKWMRRLDAAMRRKE